MGQSLVQPEPVILSFVFLVLVAAPCTRATPVYRRATGQHPQL